MANKTVGSKITFGGCTVTPTKAKTTDAPTKETTDTPAKAPTAQPDIGALLKKRKEETGMTMLERYEASSTPKEKEEFQRTEEMASYLRRHDSSVLIALKQLDTNLRKPVPEQEAKPKTPLEKEQETNEYCKRHNIVLCKAKRLIDR